MPIDVFFLFNEVLITIWPYAFSFFGELVVYYPTILEINVMFGFLAMAMLVFTVLIRVFDMDVVED
ncbi:MAG: hypothetical protein IBX40_12245 [Methanosarcinales archaeon]|nr:hypothetical protein [Methanosarcinales archaeon]